MQVDETARVHAVFRLRRDDDELATLDAARLPEPGLAERAHLARAVPMAVLHRHSRLLIQSRSGRGRQRQSGLGRHRVCDAHEYRAQQRQTRRPVVQFDLGYPNNKHRRV